MTNKLKWLKVHLRGEEGEDTITAPSKRVKKGSIICAENFTPQTLVLCHLIETKLNCLANPFCFPPPHIH